MTNEYPLVTYTPIFRPKNRPKNGAFLPRIPEICQPFAHLNGVPV